MSVRTTLERWRLALARWGRTDKPEPIQILSGTPVFRDELGFYIVVAHEPGTKPDTCADCRELVASKGGVN